MSTTEHFNATYPIGDDGHELSITLERALHGGYHASWLLFDDDSSIVAESPSLPKWYMDYCPNEIVAIIYAEAQNLLDLPQGWEWFNDAWPCTCEDEE